jgi:hypothetical protein
LEDAAMFFREKRSGANTYLQIVEGYREGRHVRQRVIGTLGRVEELRQSGKLDGLLASGARFSEKVSIIGAHRRGEVEDVETRKIGPGLVFGRLWDQLGIRDALAVSLAERQFQFDVERAIFMEAVHRLVKPGSDRAADHWRQKQALPEVADELALHQLYRAMAWLGEKLPAEEQGGRTPFAPRCVKDAIEERLFARRRTLFTDLVLAFFDTTSIHFEGEGGETLGRRGHSKNKRPDLAQLVFGLIVDGEGRPVCTEIWPGNTTDVKTLIPVVERLRQKFHVGRIIVVADRGMVSGPTLAALEARSDVQFVLGARMRTQTEVKEEVLARAGRYQVVAPERRSARDPSPLKVKEVFVEDRRYVVCVNAEEARKDAEDRQKILASLEAALRQGDKSLVGNQGYRRYLKSTGPGFAIDETKIKAEARLDGKWVLRTNSTLRTEQVAQIYKQLWMVEALFRTVKSVLETRPIYHKRDETIRGHVFCSFLALKLMRELQDRMDLRGWQTAEWASVISDLDDLQESEFETADGKHFVLRSQVRGWCGKAFQAAGVALPPTLRQVPASGEEQG